MILVFDARLPLLVPASTPDWRNVPVTWYLLDHGLRRVSHRPYFVTNDEHTPVRQSPIHVVFPYIVHMRVAFHCNASRRVNSVLFGTFVAVASWPFQSFLLCHDNCCHHRMLCDTDESSPSHSYLCSYSYSLPSISISIQQSIVDCRCHHHKIRYHKSNKRSYCVSSNRRDIVTISLHHSIPNGHNDILDMENLATVPNNQCEKYDCKRWLIWTWILGNVRHHRPDRIPSPLSKPHNCKLQQSCCCHSHWLLPVALLLL